MSADIIIVHNRSKFSMEIEQLLRSLPEFHVVRSFTDAGSAVKSVRCTLPKLFLVDLELDQLGFDCVKHLQLLLPGVPIVVINVEGNLAFLCALLNAGASGVLEKDLPLNRVPAYLGLVLEGGVALSPKIAHMLASISEQPKHLTAREKIIVNRLLAGRRQKEVAHDLGISPRTVQTHMRRLYHRHGVHSWKAFIRETISTDSQPG